jgi:hypothetical protein
VPIVQTSHRDGFNKKLRVAPVREGHSAQVVPSQQPFGHRFASQFEVHPPLTHCDPGPQLTHAAPPVPQAAFNDPDMQVVPMQQPFGHRFALHAATH